MDNMHTDEIPIKSINRIKKKLLITKQGCKETFVKEKIQRAKLRSRKEKLLQCTSDGADKTDRVSLIITHDNCHNPALPNIHRILHRKQPVLHPSGAHRLKKNFKRHLSLLLIVVLLTFVAF